MTDPTYLRDLVTLAAGVLLLLGLVTLVAALATDPGPYDVGAGLALVSVGAGTLRLQNPRFPRQGGRR